MTDTTNQTDSETGGELRAQVQASLGTLRMSQRDLAKELGVTHPSVGRWLSGKESPELEGALKKWLHQRSPLRPEPFAETSSAEQIYSALSYAQAWGDMAAVYGGPGVGKTRTLEHYRDSFDRVWVATMSPASSAVVPALEEVADAIGIQDTGGGARRISRAITRRVRANSGGLIIIDEAQHLSMSAIEELRSIHDAARKMVGLALVGNELSYARLTGGNRSLQYAQLFSRVGLKVYIKKPSNADVRVLARAAGLKSDEAVEMLERVAQRPGALRSVSKILRLAGIGGGAPTLERVKRAISNLGAEV
jgi:DNA transposition AAA+ family ATPase